jgi:hypothetical protein
MKRLGMVLATLMLALGVVAVVSPKAYAASAPITRMVVQATVATDGTITVAEEFDMNFSTPGHGPYLYFTTRQGSGQANQYRIYDYTFKSVTSSTGAPANFITETPQYGTTALRIGDASKTVSGSQTYTVSYTVKGIVNPNVASSGMDELYWNVIGTGFTIPISNITVSVTGPAAVQKTTCYTGANFDQSCSSNGFSADSANYTQANLSTGQGLAIAAGWPVGTFVGAGPTFETHTGSTTSSSPLSSLSSPVGLGVAGVVVLGAIGGLIAASRRGRDEMYAGLTPGNVPVAGEPAPVEKVSSIPFAVQFTPPKDVLPGMIGTLFDEKAETRDVTATLVDLAARGYWRIEQPNPKGDFQIVKLAPPQGLTGYEQLLYDALFGDGSQVVTSGELEGKSFGQSVQAIERELYTAVTAVGWFKGNPQTARGVRTTFGIVILFAAFFLGFSAGALVVAIPLAVVGAAVAISSRFAPVRSALGSAVTSQALGFKQYLETAEADQIKFEEGQDIFSRYLPYAIAYGCADRWAKIFAELAARGVPMTQPTWYIGPGYGYGYGAAWGAGGFDSIISTLDGFSSSAATAMTAATAGSSGGSGFSGGGFGGGGGGGGGGSW